MTSELKAALERKCEEFAKQHQLCGVTNLTQALLLFVQSPLERVAGIAQEICNLSHMAWTWENKELLFREIERRGMLIKQTLLLDFAPVAAAEPAPDKGLRLEQVTNNDSLIDVRYRTMVAEAKAEREKKRAPDKREMDKSVARKLLCWSWWS
jgi:hypothetical protein